MAEKGLTGRGGGILGSAVLDVPGIREDGAPLREGYGTVLEYSMSANARTSEQGINSALAQREEREKRERREREKRERRERMRTVRLFPALPVVVIEAVLLVFCRDIGSQINCIISINQHPFRTWIRKSRK
jgi:hypothetical protein